METFKYPIRLSGLDSKNSIILLNYKDLPIAQIRRINKSTISVEFVNDKSKSFEVVKKNHYEYQIVESSKKVGAIKKNSWKSFLYTTFEAHNFEINMGYTIREHLIRIPLFFGNSVSDKNHFLDKSYPYYTYNYGKILNSKYDVKNALKETKAQFIFKLDNLYMKIKKSPTEQEQMFFTLIFITLGLREVGRF